MSASVILWVYIGFLLVGGLIGFLKAKSAMSLVASAVFAVALVLCQLHILSQPLLPEILLAVLCLVFLMRLLKTKKFMPSGMLLVVTILTIVLRRLV